MRLRQLDLDLRPRMSLVHEDRVAPQESLTGKAVTAGVVADHVGEEVEQVALGIVDADETRARVGEVLARGVDASVEHVADREHRSQQLDNVREVPAALPAIGRALVRGDVTAAHDASAYAHARSDGAVVTEVGVRGQLAVVGTEDAADGGVGRAELGTRQDPSGES